MKNNGPGICTTVFTVFLVLKLAHVIDWSWWWITAPLWIPASVAAAFLLALVIYTYIVVDRSAKDGDDDEERLAQ